MKRYRCPHCGKVAFSPADRFFMSCARWCFFRLYRYDREDKGILAGCFCESCDELVLPEKGSSFFNALFFINRLFFGFPAAPIFIIGLYNVGVLHWIFIPLAWLYWIAYAAYIIVCWLTKPMLPYNKHSWRLDHPIILKAETQVAVHDSKYIKPYSVYGLKFKAETASEKLKEAFSDGMVPAVFHPNEKGSLTYDVRIINRSAVPDEILFEGAKFLVEDFDGIFIAKGTIEKSNLDC